ncbi:MAG: cupin domain-containing protein [Candidatus Sulfopaludibacter sp.]|nr:cupin domain-containing protein [Candidatus Sulfopaludibacter sp.]
MKRRELLGIAAAVPLFAEGALPLPDSVVDANQAKVTHEPFGDTRIFFEGPTGQLNSMTAGSLRLNPGMEPHPPHQHPEEEFMIVTEGHGEILVDGKIHPVGPGSMMYSASNRLHGIKNTGKNPLLFYFYKWRK